MVRLEIEMAVIGTINELLQSNKKNNEYLSIDADIVSEYSRLMEIRSGYAVVNGFSSISLNQFFSNCYELFQYDPYRSVEKGKPSYRLRIEKLLPHPEFTEMRLKNLEEQQINTLVGRMMDILDPSVNYPLNFLEDMKLIGVLTQ